jgi:hypothetical protein
MLSGILGSVVVNGSAYNLGKWRISMKNKAVDRAGFLSQGYQANAKGRTGGTISISGPYDGVGPPLTVGDDYEFTLGFTDDLNIVVNARVTDITPANDADDGPVVDISAESNGPFTAAIV